MRRKIDGLTACLDGNASAARSEIDAPGWRLFCAPVADQRRKSDSSGIASDKTQQRMTNAKIVHDFEQTQAVAFGARDDGG